MARMQLAALCTLLLALLPCQALNCLSNSACCSKKDADDVGKFLVAGMTNPSLPQLPPASQPPKECWASSEGEPGQRSASPWRYRLDWNPNRYPEYLNQAYCSCSHCISLDSKDHGHLTNYTQRASYGNSHPVKFHTLVFYREACSADRYYLKPRSIPVTVSCACLATRHKS